MVQCNPAQAPVCSPEQKQVWDNILEILRKAGVDLKAGGDLKERGPQARDKERRVFAVLGRAGSGKTGLLGALAKALEGVGVRLLTGDYEPARKDGARTLAVLAPTNKAASLLRERDVGALTIHRILYKPVYDPKYAQIADWLLGEAGRPEIENVSNDALARAESFFKERHSIPGALASIGIKGSDFIIGWTRRDEELDIGIVDEASMIDSETLKDLRDIFPTLILFGDPAQLAPVGGDGSMGFDGLKDSEKTYLHHIHRQATGNPILALAERLGDEDISFRRFEEELYKAAKGDERISVRQSFDAELMARSPALVWRNATRRKMITAFRSVFDAPPDMLLAGEPLICDGIELPLKHRRLRLDLEARGLIKGAQAIYLGAGKRAGFSRIHVLGAKEPRFGVASIVRIERAEEEQEPFIPYAARMGAAFLHGAAITIHKAQGSQWREVQIYAPDLFVAARAGRSEAGIALWKRLTYVAITRASERLIWITCNRMARPKKALGIDDLSQQAECEEHSFALASSSGAEEDG